MKKLHVNEEACIGCGACVAIDGTHFDFNDDGLSEVISNENVDTEEARNAVSSCPTNAISYIEETDNNEQEKENNNCECENCTCENCECTEGECHCEDCGDECECESSEDENCTCHECHCHDEETE